MNKPINLKDILKKDKRFHTNKELLDDVWEYLLTADDFVIVYRTGDAIKTTFTAQSLVSLTGMLELSKDQIMSSYDK